LEININNVSRNFGNKLVISKFDCKLSNGVYGLVGPNGAGKSTLLKIMAGILKPSTGSILVDNEDIYKMDERYRDILGYLPQSMGIYRNFTTKEFLLYFAALKGIENDKAIKRIEELLKLVGLENEYKSKIGKFSGGMKKRLGIVLTLLNDPKIIILDEPTAALDPNERMKFRNIISEISKDRIILLSTHIVSDIEYIANEILFMKSGTLIRRGTSQEVLKELEGMVWQYTTDDSKISEIKEKHKISNILRVENEVSIRIISKKKPFEGAEEKTPNLDDIYLHYFGEGAI
jgi:ABC-2 type transport system ATP-binding protein